MKTSFKTTLLAALLFASSGTLLRADVNDLGALATYADTLNQHGITGHRFVELVDERYWGLYPSVQQPGMGSYVQEMQSRGLRGGPLAEAIQAEQQRRGSQVKLPAGKLPEDGALPMDRPDR